MAAFPLRCVAWLVAIWSSRVSTSESTREMKEATDRMAARSRPAAAAYFRPVR